MIFLTNPFIFCIARRFGRRLQPIFRQFVNLISHNKYNVLRSNSTKKGFVGTESERYILELKISSWEYPYVLSFILNKTLWSCGAKFARKVILGTKLKRAIVKFRINTPEYLFVWTFILNKVLWNWGTKFAQNRYFRRKDSENNCRRQNQDPSIPLCIEFHFKQSTFKFRDQICPKNVFWGWHLVK